MTENFKSEIDGNTVRKRHDIKIIDILKDNMRFGERNTGEFF